MKRKRLAVLGGGINSAVGRAHLSALNLSDKWEYRLGLFSRDTFVNQESAEVWGVAHYANSFEEFFDSCREHAEVILILTPTPNHYQNLKQLIPLGIPIICEKSVTASYSQAKEIETLIQIHKTKLFITFNYTGYPMIREIKERIKKGSLGEIHNFNIKMLQDGFLSRDTSGGKKKVQAWRQKDYDLATVSLDLGVHCFNLLEFILNDDVVRLVGVQGTSGLYEPIVDGVHSIIKTKGNAVGQMQFGKVFLGHKNNFEISVFGTDGSITWRQEWPNEFIISDKFGECSYKTFASPDLIFANDYRYMRFKAGHPFGFIEAFSNLYDDIYDSINGHKSEYVFGIESAKKGLLALTGIQYSSNSNAWIDIEALRDK